MPASIAFSRMYMIASIGFTPIGHTSLQYRHVSQSQIPFGGLYSLRRSTDASSGASATNRYAFASAAGPRYSGFASRDVHSLRHEPHMMQSCAILRRSILCFGTTYGPFGGSAPGRRYGSTS